MLYPLDMHVDILLKWRRIEETAQLLLMLTVNCNILIECDHDDFNQKVNEL